MPSNRLRSFSAWCGAGSDKGTRLCIALGLPSNAHSSQTGQSLEWQKYRSVTERRRKLATGLSWSACRLSRAFCSSLSVSNRRSSKELTSWWAIAQLRHVKWAQSKHRATAWNAFTVQAGHPRPVPLRSTALEAASFGWSAAVPPVAMGVSILHWGQLILPVTHFWQNVCGQLKV